MYSIYTFSSQTRLLLEFGPQYEIEFYYASSIGNNLLEDNLPTHIVLTQSCPGFLTLNAVRFI